MNRILGTVSLSAAFLAGCADSGDYNQGAAPAVETESSSSTNYSVTNSDPGVAPETGTYGDSGNPSSLEQFNSLGSASAPSATLPANVATNETNASQQPQSLDDSGSAPVNEQGNQISPEPNTGDDANPDSIQPEAR